MKTIPAVVDALDSIYEGLNHAPSPTTVQSGSTVLQGCLPLLMEEIPAEALIQRVGQKKYERWRDLYRQATLLNMWYSLESKLVLEAISEARIPVMVLKGADIASTLYPRPELRHFGDVDLMLQPHHLADTIAIFERLGYHYHQEYRFEAISKDRSAFVYVKEVKVGHVVFEIHTSPHSNEMGVSFDIAQLWKRARPITVAGVPVSGMGLEDLLLYLCWHFRSHAFNRLIWLYDIAIFLLHRADQLDWTLVYRLAHEQRLLSTVYYCLRWSEQVFQVPIPECADIARFSPPVLIQKLITHYIGVDFIPVLKRTARRKQKLLQRLTVDSMGKLCQTMLRLIFPSPTHLGRLYMEKYRLPVRLYWLYYPLHPLFLLKSFLENHRKRKS